MNILNRIKSLCKYYDRFSDEISDKAIKDEYSFFLKLSLHYPNLKVPLPFFAHVIHMLFVLSIVLLHIYFIVKTLIVSQPEDYTMMIHTLHLGIIIFLYSLLMIPFNLSRYAICRSYRMIGKGVFIYEGEKITDEENEMIKYYRKLIRKVKITFPTLYIIAGSCKLIIAPCIDYLLGTNDPRTYTSGGINLSTLLPMWYPIESHEGIVYYICMIGQMIYIYDGIFSLSLAMCCYFTSLIHVAIQLERLIISLKNIEKRALKIYYNIKPNYFEMNLKLDKIYKEKLFLNCIEYCFKENIKHSQQIFRFV
ncbi:hypothetical protein O3M35_008027 [Rhynocoris fuscipes]|uniref:Odorant receptor n=1 Tax=Rhynocoris fuscipes TaxID=488301 RepID=A0AAW1D7P7_9HEMI